MTPYLNQIICGDALEVMKSLDPKQIGVVILDPPWKKYSSHHNDNKFGPWSQWRRNDNFKDIMNSDVPFDPSPWLAWSDKTKLCFWGANEYLDKLPFWKGWHIWDKTEGTPQIGVYSDCEMCLTNLSKNPKVFSFLWRGLARRGRANISRSPKLHPNQKPVELAIWQILQCNLDPEQIIFEPYGGSGFASVAAVALGHPYICVELDPFWIPTIEREIKKEESQPRLFYG
jgi:DNA modification methylase